MLAKIKWFVIIVMFLSGCTSKSINANYEEYYNNTINVKNYKITHNIIASFGNEKISTETLFLFDNDLSYTQFTQDDIEVKQYLIDGILYTEVGESKFKMFDNSSLNSFIDSISVRDILSYESSSKSGIVDFTINVSEEEKTNNIKKLLNELGIDSTNVTSSEFTISAKGKDNKIIEINKKTEITLNDKNKFMHESIYKFSDIGETVIKKPDNLEEYLFPEEDNIENVKMLLEEILGYKRNGNVLSVKFNDNESYSFDFDNGVFTYTLLSSSSIYNFKNNIGTFNNCTYDFNTFSKSGSCTDEEFERVKYTKIYLGIELDSIGKTLSDIK